MREIKFRVFDTDRKVWVKNLTYTVDDITSVIKDWHKISQYTGLKDKNGVEIYEGDIVDYGNERYKPVEFINGCFCICGNTAMPTLMTLFPVIGNIYQNPELLNK